MQVIANGECCDQDHGTEDCPETLAIIPETDNVTLGLLYEEHNEGCLFKRMGSSAPHDYECDCENFGFSWTPCDACGCRLAGDRYGATGWANERVKV